MHCSRLALPLATLGCLLGAVAPAQAAPVQADLDQDGVFDDLEGRLRHVPPSQNVRVLVSLARDATAARAARLERAVDSLDIRDRFAVVDAVAAVVDAGHVRELAAEPGVLHVERDGIVHATNASAQESFGVTEARLDVPALDGNADGLATYSKDDLVAAVIDTGIQASHADLNGGKVLAFQDFTEPVFDEALDTPYDENGHGTHVSGTIAGDGSGDGKGVAPGAALVGLKVLKAANPLNPEGPATGSSSDVIAAIDWVWKDPDGPGGVAANGVTYGIEAINLSLGGTGCSDGQDLESQAVNSASDAGYVVAIAAGNDGPAGCGATTGISSPGAAEKAITVGAMADLGRSGFYLAGFSSRGPTLDGRTKPDVSAPGVGVTSADNAATGYVTLTGTSMATPFVAGVALLMRDQNPLLTSAEVKTKIMGTAIDWGSTGTDSDYGAGRLDAYAAIAAASTPTPAQLTTPPTALPSYQRVQSTLAATGSTRFYTITAGSTFPLTLGLTVGTASQDFDMYLFDADGTQVANAETPHRQDELHLSSGSAGPYTLRVQSFSGSGTFFLDVSGGNATENGTVAAPANTTPPAVSGTAALGGTLSGTPGTWDGSPTFAYEWERCTSKGASCAGTGDKDTEYTITSADAGKGLRLAVTASNPGGDTVARSNLVLVPAEPPSNTGSPSIGGEARDGGTLSASSGSWSGTDPLTFAYSWERCGSDGSGCTSVQSGAASAYTLVPADVGSRLRVVVTATNAGGSASAASSLTAVVEAIPPASTTAPSIAGAALLGATLTGDDGAWSGTQPISIARQWIRCDTSGDGCTTIVGATETTYAPADADVGSRLRLRVTATNAGGSSLSDSPATETVTVVPPANSSAPSLSGPARDGRRLRLAAGGWDGTGPIVFGYRWLRCDTAGAGCEPIAGATASSYVLSTSDVGGRVLARVLASNVAGTAQADTAPSAVVPPTPPRLLALPSITGRARRGGELSARGGTWWGTRPLQFSVQWLRCSRFGERCHAIRGATDSIYLPRAADLGRRLRLRVTATNSVGRRGAISDTTAVVRSLPAQRPRRTADPLSLRVKLARGLDTRPSVVRVTLPG